MTITVDRSEEFEAMRRRLRLINRGEKTMEMEDAEYWGDRFTSLHVRFWAGPIFKKYLIDPLYWDTIAAAIRARYSDHRRPPHQHRLLVVSARCGLVRLTISCN